MIWYAVGRSQQRLSATEWFHGSSAERGFDRFDFTKDRSEEQGDGYRHWNSYLGTHFTPYHDMAANLAAAHNGVVFHCSLSMQNPKRYESEWDLGRDAHDWATRSGRFPDLKQKDPNFGHHHPSAPKDHLLGIYHDKAGLAEGFRQHLKNQGHDGILYGNEYENRAGESKHECAIALHPDDITINSHHMCWDDSCGEHTRCPECSYALAKQFHGECEACGEHVDWHDQHLGALTQHFAAEEPRLWPSHPEYRAGDRVMETTPNGKQFPGTVQRVDEPEDPDYPGRVWVQDDEDRRAGGVHPSRLSPHPDAPAEQIAWHEQQKAKNAAGEPYVPEAERNIDESDRTTVRHLTEKHDFHLDTAHRPHNNTTMGGDLSSRLFVGSPEHWANHSDYGYRRPYVAEIDVPKDAVKWGGYGGEGTIPGRHFDKAKVTRVLPYHEYERESSDPDYHSTVDTRSWSPEQHREHLKNWRTHLHENHGWGWNEFNDQHEHVGLGDDDWDEHMRDPNHGYPGTYVRRDREGKPMLQPRSMLTRHFAMDEGDKNLWRERIKEQFFPKPVTPFKGDMLCDHHLKQEQDMAKAFGVEDQEPEGQKQMGKCFSCEHSSDARRLVPEMGLHTNEWAGGYTKPLGHEGDCSYCGYPRSTKLLFGTLHNKAGEIVGAVHCSEQAKGAGWSEGMTFRPHHPEVYEHFIKNKGAGQPRLPKTPFEPPEHLRPSLSVRAVLESTHYEGETGNRDHITCNQRGTVPTHQVQHLLGARDEQPGEHRNRQGPKWDSFLDDVRSNGIKEPIFITVDHGEQPRISEGNHRRDAAVELGLPEVPVHIRYYGHAEHAKHFGSQHLAFGNPMGDQDWDEIHPDLPDEVHRGLGVNLPDDLHRFVHDESQPRQERAMALLRHLHTPEAREHPHWRDDRIGIGTSWSGDDGVAEDFAKEGAEHHTDHNQRAVESGARAWETYPEAHLGKPGTAVVIHAHTPERDEIDEDPNGDGSGMRYTYHGHGEREVPVHGGTSMRIKGISWRPVLHMDHPGWVTDPETYTRHDFDRPMRAEARKASEILSSHGILEGYAEGGGHHGEEDGTGRRAGPRLDQPGGRRRHPGAPGRWLRAGAARAGHGRGRRRVLAADEAPGDEGPGVDWHRAAHKEFRKLDKPAQKSVQKTIDGLLSGAENVQIHPLAGDLKGWHSAKASRGHRVVHQWRDGNLYIGGVSLHEYPNKRFGVKETSGWVEYDDLPEEGRQAVRHWTDVATPEELEHGARDFHWQIEHVPTEEVKRRVMRHGEDIDQHTFDDYHRWYLEGGDVPNHGSSRWPVIESHDPQEAGEYIDDGHHRLHSYIRAGDRHIPVMRFRPKHQAVKRLEPLKVKVKMGEPQPIGNPDVEDPRTRSGTGSFDNSGEEPQWVQPHEDLVTDALHAWRGWPSAMVLHMRHHHRGDPTHGYSGSGRIMRAQAEALHTEVQQSKPTTRRLYRGSHEDDLHPLMPTTWSESRLVAEHWAGKGGGKVHTLEPGEARGIQVSKYLGHDPERQWLVVAHPERKEAARTQTVHMPVQDLLGYALPRSSDVVDEDKVREYAEQMRAKGYDSDWADDNDDHVRILDNRVLNGNHRIHAADDAGLKTLPVEVLDEGHIGKRAGLDLDGYISVAENTMERAGHEGNHWDLPKGREGDPEYHEAKRPVETFVNDVLKPHGIDQRIKVHPDHWDLRHGGHGVTDGYNFIGVKAHTTDHTLLHECAHIINRSREGSGHDAAFAHTLRDLYRTHISPEAAETFWNVASGHPDIGRSD